MVHDSLARGSMLSVQVEGSLPWQQTMHLHLLLVFCMSSGGCVQAPNPDLCM